MSNFIMVAMDGITEYFRRCCSKKRNSVSAHRTFSDSYFRAQPARTTKKVPKTQREIFMEVMDTLSIEFFVLVWKAYGLVTKALEKGKDNLIEHLKQTLLDKMQEETSLAVVGQEITEEEFEVLCGAYKKEWRAFHKRIAEDLERVFVAHEQPHFHIEELLGFAFAVLIYPNLSVINLIFCVECANDFLRYLCFQNMPILLHKFYTPLYFQLFFFTIH